jgi:hypothetical protein
MFFRSGSWQCIKVRNPFHNIVSYDDRVVLAEKSRWMKLTWAILGGVQMPAFMGCESVEIEVSFSTAPAENYGGGGGGGLQASVEQVFSEDFFQPGRRRLHVAAPHADAHDGLVVRHAIASRTRGASGDDDDAVVVLAPSAPAGTAPLVAVLSPRRRRRPPLPERRGPPIAREREAEKERKKKMTGWPTGFICFC